MTTVNVHEAKTNFSHFIDRAHAGEEIIVAKAGKPHVKIVALEGATAAEKPKRRKPGGWKGFELPDSFWDPLPPGWTGE